MSQRKAVLIFLLVIAVIAGIVGMLHRSGIERIKQSETQSVGYVYRANRALGKYSRGVLIYYRYVVDGKQYERTANKADLHKAAASTFLIKNFTVRYERSDPENSLILITPNDFEKIGLPFPDSLAWVKECLRK